MLFSSLVFLFLFLPITFLLYFLVRKRWVKNGILLLASLLFYAWGEPVYVILMIATILASYVYGRAIHYFETKKNQKGKVAMLILSVITLLAGLTFFKYSDFLIQNINQLFGQSIPLLKLPLPIGISFYSFQILSYVIDLYTGKVKVQKNVFHLALYVSLFPQLIAGPIVRYETVEKELKTRKESLNGIIGGIKRFIIGLSKKILIANQMGLIADAIFNSGNVSELGTLLVWIGALAYTFQIFFDFCGYSDMAIGLGEIFGFHFLENFNFPYISKSITDFWRRWHISLSTWFRDYVYIPLGGNRVKKWKWVRNIIIVWFLTGLWHGASWNFILWGLYFAVILLIEKLWLEKYLKKMPQFFSWCYAFLLIVIGWVIFRSNQLGDIGVLLSQMFIPTSSNIQGFMQTNSNILSSLVYFIPAILFSFPWFKNWIQKHEKNSVIRVGINIGLLILFLTCITFLTSSTYNPFIYFRF